MRTIALVIAAAALVVFVGGCGAGTSKADLAAQDKAVQLGNQLTAIHKRVAQARRLVARQRRITAGLGSASTRTVPTPAVARTVRPGAFSLDRLCGRPNVVGNSKAARRLRNQQARARRQALYRLNLSCPSSRS